MKILDNRGQAEKDKQAEKRAIRAEIAEINTAIDELVKAVFDPLSNSNKIDVLRKGLQVGLKAVKWLLRNSL